ncbi:methyltransferase family protein [Hydrocarboniphaga effusa]|jgi:protein-S-isoprenylcysteine O-methyltransferase Ste14|uniref:methyltransferase family protein n=1 Tax=Hydrocarboniphaga effusa TaxID=243629 RepID=UPI003BAD41C8
MIMNSAPTSESRVQQRRRFWATRTVCVAILALFALSRSGWHQVDSLVPHLLMQFGIVLAAVGAIGRIWSSSYAAGNKNSVLLTVGPYSLVRNPLYVSSYLGGLGIAITTETLTIPILLTVWFVWYYRTVVAGEEQHLQQLHGSRFKTYMKSVPRFIPSKHGLLEPYRWEMSPRSFRQSLIQVIWFVVAAVVIHGLHDVRLALGEPALLTLY